MRCPKCDVAIPIGQEVCVRCGYNVRTKMVERKVEPIKQEPPRKEPPKPVPKVVCPKCGTELSNGTNVCPKCSYNIWTGRYEKREEPVPPSPKPAPKKENGFVKFLKRFGYACLIVTVSYMVRLGIGMLFSNNVSSKPSASRTTAQVQETAAPTVESVNPAFTAVLQAKGLSYTPQLTSKSSECYVIEQEDYVEVIEFSFSGDRLLEMYDTVYYSLNEYNGSEVEEVKKALMEHFQDQVSPSYASVTGNTYGSYYGVTLHFTNMTSKLNMQAMFIDGWLESGVGDYISKSSYVNDLMAQGAIQR